MVYLLPVVMVVNVLSKPWDPYRTRVHARPTSPSTFVSSEVYPWTPAGCFTEKSTSSQKPCGDTRWQAHKNCSCRVVRARLLALRAQQVSSLLHEIFVGFGFAEASQYRVGIGKLFDIATVDLLEYTRVRTRVLCWHQSMDTRVMCAVYGIAIVTIWHSMLHTCSYCNTME